MDLINGLKTFLRVAQTGSFSAVASERGVTQPAISRQVSAVEEYFGTRLVQRSTQAVTLTEEGRDLLEPAQQLIDDAEALQFAAGARRGRAVGCVRLAIPVGLGLMLSERLKPLLSQHPELSVDLVLSDSGCNLIEDGLELEVRLGPLQDSPLIARLIGQTSAYLVASPAYLATRTPLQHPEDLQRHDCIVHPAWAPDSRWRFVRQNEEGEHNAEEVVIAMKARVKTNNAATVYLATLTGQGIALLSHFSVVRDIKAGRLCHLLPEYRAPRSQIFLLYPSKRIMPPRTRVVIEYLSELFGKDPEMEPNPVTHRD